MFIVATLTCMATLTSFGWAVLRFFVKPAGPTWRAVMTAALGLFFGAWHVVAIATATTEVWRVALGMTAHAAASLLFWTAVRACRSQPLTAIFEPDLPLRVVEDGPFAYLRHPFYSAYTIFWLGGWVASGSLVALCSVAVMLGIYVHGAREEERKFSRSPVAAEYADYRQRVGAWLPRRRVGRNAPLLTCRRPQLRSVGLGASDRLDRSVEFRCLKKLGRIFKRALHLQRRRGDCGVQGEALPPESLR